MIKNMGLPRIKTQIMKITNQIFTVSRQTTRTKIFKLNTATKMKTPKNKNLGGEQFRKKA
jgi:hypothetical protein